MILLSFCKDGKEYIYFLDNDEIIYGYRVGKTIKYDLTDDEIILMDNYVKFISIDDSDDLWEVRNILYKWRKYTILKDLETKEFFISKKLKEYYAIYSLDKIQQKKLKRLVRRKKLMPITFILSYYLASSFVHDSVPYSTEMMVKALEKNDDLSDNEKRFLQSKFDILEEHEEYVDALEVYNNLKYLDIEYSLVPNERSVERNAAAYYSPSQDKIVVNNTANFTTTVSSLNLTGYLSHEITHTFTPWHFLSFCTGLYEACVEVISNEYMGGIELNQCAYQDEIVIFYTLNEIIGTEPFKKLVFSGDRLTVVDELNNIIDDNSLALDLINKIDSLRGIMLENKDDEYSEIKYEIYKIIGQYFEAKYGYSMEEDETMMVYFCYGNFIPLDQMSDNFKCIKTIYPKACFSQDYLAQNGNTIYTNFNTMFIEEAFEKGIIDYNNDGEINLLLPGHSSYDLIYQGGEIQIVIYEDVVIDTPQRENKNVKIYD